MISKEKLESILKSYQTHHLSLLPTPLHKMENLSRQTGDRINLFIKRDDLSGMAMGGNKNRKLDFIMADIQRQKADTIITWGGIQSNWCRQVAAVAKIFQKKAILILFKKPGAKGEKTGNLLLGHMFKADIRIVEAQSNQKLMAYQDVKEHIDPIVNEVRKEGQRPYILSIGGSAVEGSMTRPLGSIAYVNGFKENLIQFQETGQEPDAIVLATGSGGTQAGLLAGKILLGSGCRIIGVTVSEDKKSMGDCVKGITGQILADILERPPRVEEKDTIILDDYLGNGYGVVTPEISQAISLVAETEGILLDPVYTGKAMTGLLDLLKNNYFEKGENVIFWHTGGLPVLFA